MDRKFSLPVSNVMGLEKSLSTQIFDFWSIHSLHINWKVFLTTVFPLLIYIIFNFLELLRTHSIFLVSQLERLRNVRVTYSPH